MKRTFKLRTFFTILLGLLPVCSVASDQRFDGIWVGTENVTLATRSDCPKPNYATSLHARIAVAQGGTLLAVVDGYGTGRYMNPTWSGGALVFEMANKRRGELHISADGKTLTETGFIRRTTTVTSGQRSGAVSGQAPQASGFTACVDQLTGTFHRER